MIKPVGFLNKLNNKRFRFDMPEHEYFRLNNEYSGLCIACGAEACGDTEPDARGYPCEDCNQHKVYGASELLMMGFIRFVDETPFQETDAP